MQSRPDPGGAPAGGTGRHAAPDGVRDGRVTGQLFGDRYQVGDTLGFGGMSEVHRGRDLRLGRDVALKVLRADLARDPSFQARFRREAQNAASLNHPAIVAVYDTGETQGESGPVPYIVMEYVDGETLRDLLKREGPLPPRRAMEIIADVCAALDFSHRHGIVHRDIKPANIMLTRAGAVKVMDFGIARAVADGQSAMTATAAVIGTAQYLSPEQARGEAVDARSDVYATGCVLFELLTGAPPFTGDSPVAVAYQHVREDPKPPSEIRPGLPRDLDAIVLKALNKNPLNRYQTAAEMRSDLVRALSGQAVHATPLMPEEERTRIIKAPPQRIGAVAAPAPLLAPPRRVLPDEMWEDEDAPDRARKVWGFVGIGVLCAALLAGAILLTLKLTSGGHETKSIAVPQVQGETQASATAALRKLGLTIGTVTQVESDDSQKGKVVSQNPSQGTVVTAGQRVNLEVGRGKTSVLVPDLSGMDAATAKDQLARMNLQYKQRTAASTDNDKNKVFQQDPAPNSEVKPGSTITVTIGTGVAYKAIPKDLVGKQFADAKAELVKLGLDATQQSVDGTEPANQVLGLSGAQPGDPVQAGTVITLQVSNNSLFVMPPLTNQTPEQAAAQLKQAGWKGDVGSLGQRTQDVTERAQVGAVVAQTPAAGSKLNKINPVQVTVGKALSWPVPGVVGQVLDDAVAAMNNQGIPSGNIDVVQQPGYAPAGQAYHVLSQSVSSGSPLEFDQTVTLLVYGPEAPKTTSRPPTTPSTSSSSSSSSSSSTPPPPPTTTPPSTSSSSSSAPATTANGGGNGNGNGRTTARTGG
ncbi:Stk1 family PASTA domain-containing Ser/Thr kinase [Nakamurella endophytica]|uniref:non-specific serine/threonine protein kinase n=1 Tax=Nakamurella endophytica TaxID=1748367 RepID=A0A917WF78_9ACTN|nr:Stk1 family PASTA domain-containing Ser/Thr kinase [Nakamurella endophytica]GGM00143.1 serine/threonine protein kinase [Nakamurella endophytica]